MNKLQYLTHFLRYMLLRFQKVSLYPANKWIYNQEEELICKLSFLTFNQYLSRHI